MQRIIVDIDDPTANDQPALDAASAHCPADATIQLFHNIYHRNIGDPPHTGNSVLREARELLIKARRKQLRALGKRFFGTATAVQICWSEHGWQELVRHAIAERCDLLVAQSQRHSRWQRVGLDNEDWELIRHCPMPLILARGTARNECPYVIAAIDPLHADDKPADLDRRILQHASAVARHHGCPLGVINIVELLATATAPLPVASVGLVFDHLDEAVDAHSLAVTELQRGLKCQHGDTRVVAGIPSDEIVEFVESRKAALLVMGAVSRSTISRLLIGNTAERVLDRLSCDVMVVKPADFNRRQPALASLKSVSQKLI